MNIEQFAYKVKSAVAAASQKEVHIHKVLKLNGILLHGITIREPDASISPTIYLEPYLEQYRDSENLEEITASILTVYYKHNQTKTFDTDQVRDFHQIRHKLYYRLINYEANQELLQSVPHSRFLDLAKVYYMDFPIDDFNDGSVLVRNENMEDWGISDCELKQTAEENTPCLYPFSISNMCDLIPSVELPPEAASGLPPESPAPMFVLSNEKKAYGAAALCYEKILDHFSQSIGSDLIVLPSSVHETILLPLNTSIHIDCLRATVYDINRTMVNRSDFLSDNVYYFYRKAKQLTIA